MIVDLRLFIEKAYEKQKDIYTTKKILESCIKQIQPAAH
jgi:hypothetical protein